MNINQETLIFDIMFIRETYREPEKIKRCIVNGCRKLIEPPDYVCNKCKEIYGDDVQCRGQTIIAAYQIYYSHGIKINSFHKMVNDAIQFLKFNQDIKRADIRNQLKEECNWKNSEAIRMAASIAWGYVKNFK